MCLDKRPSQPAQTEIQNVSRNTCSVSETSVRVLPLLGRDGESLGVGLWAAVVWLVWCEGTWRAVWTSPNVKDTHRNNSLETVGHFLGIKICSSRNPKCTFLFCLWKIYHHYWSLFISNPIQLIFRLCLFFDQELGSVYSILAAILNAGDIEFTSVASEHQTDKSNITNMAVLENGELFLC